VGSEAHAQWWEKQTETRRRHALRWKDPDAAQSYRFRPIHPDETLAVVESLTLPANRRVLDIGCGTGNLTRPLAARMERVDAVDIAREMIEEAKTLPGGDAANIRWQVAPAEQAEFDGPYGLIVAGESMHWMDYRVLLPRLAEALDEGGMLVAAAARTDPAPWDEAVRSVIVRHSTNQDYVPFDMITAWTEAGLFRQAGTQKTSAVPQPVSIDEFVAGHHAMSSLTRAHIDAAAFDAELRAALEPYCRGGIVPRSVYGELVWGVPLAGE
jgi:SAM-dependent methyltransferase